MKKLANLRSADFDGYEFSDVELSPIVIDGNAFVKLQDGKLLQNVVGVSVSSDLSEFTEMTIKLRVPNK